MRSKFAFLALYGALGVLSSPLGSHDSGQLETLVVIPLFENC